MNDLLRSDDVVHCKPVIKAIIEGINRRFYQLFDFHYPNVDAAMAAISHPRFKGRWLAQFSELEQKTIHQRFLNIASKEALIEASNSPGQLEDDEFQFGTSVRTIEEFEPFFTARRGHGGSNSVFKKQRDSARNFGKVPDHSENFPKIQHAIAIVCFRGTAVQLRNNNEHPEIQ